MCVMYYTDVIMASFKHRQSVNFRTREYEREFRTHALQETNFVLSIIATK